jgi:hypothetical protein
MGDWISITLRSVHAFVEHPAEPKASLKRLVGNWKRAELLFFLTYESPGLHSECEESYRHLLLLVDASLCS